MKQIPDELKLKIYHESDIETRIKLNKEFNWSFKYVNPLENIKICHIHWNIYYDSNIKFQIIIVDNLYTKKIIEPKMFNLEPIAYQPSGRIQNKQNKKNKQLSGRIQNKQNIQNKQLSGRIQNKHPSGRI